MNQDKIANIFGLEGGHLIENDLDKLKNLYNRSVGQMTLTWISSNSWATKCLKQDFRESSKIQKSYRFRKEGCL